MDDPGLPIKLGPCSNGEFAPPPTTELVREAVRRARRLCEENARRIGMDRRDFLFTSMGAATTLFALAACSDEQSGGRSGGSYDVPDEAMVDADASLEALGDAQPVLDVQTHMLDLPEGYAEDATTLFPFRTCGEANPNDCFTPERWVEEIFGRSDTTVAVLSALPVGDGEIDPMSPDSMAATRERLLELCAEDRVLAQGHAWPNVGRLDAALDAMTEELENFPLISWKTYTHAGEGWSFDDHAGRRIGERFLNHVEEIGPNIVCVHKGLTVPGEEGREWSSPADIGPAAKAHPDIRFAVYHAAFEPDNLEGEYNPDDPKGIDRFIKSLEDNGIGPGENVYADIGSTWKLSMTNPDAAAHAIGKLLVAVGEDRILWGTDSIWYGSPQDQIRAFRTFRISDELQERFGYPALTDEVRHKIMWRNAADLFDVDVAKFPCELDARDLEESRRSSAARLGNRTYGPTTRRQALRLFRAEHPWAF
jgi:uncharacterized protein